MGDEHFNHFKSLMKHLTRGDDGEDAGLFIFPRDERDDEPSEAAKCVRTDVKEYFTMADSQITIPSFPLNIDILTDYGKQRFANVQQLVRDSPPKQIFQQYALMQSPSGIWCANEKSPWYNGQPHELNSDRNIVIHGLYYAPNSEKKSFMATSPVIFVTQDWCYTHSGSIYRLIEQVDAVTFMALAAKEKLNS